MRFFAGEMLFLDVDNSKFHVAVLTNLKRTQISVCRVAILFSMRTPNSSVSKF